MKEVFIVLPGSSNYNKSWVEEWGEYFESTHSDCDFIGVDWPHWDGGVFDINQEVDRVYNEVKPYITSTSHEVTILAKSLGTRVLAQLFYKLDAARFKKVIFMGIPFKSLKKDGELSDSYECLMDIDYENITFIQEQHDPLGSFQKVHDFLEEYDIQVEQIDGSSHKYDLENVLEKVEFEASID